MKEIIKNYSNGEITVVWQPSKCSHSKKCFHDLPEVFDPGKRPWVNIEGSDTDTIVDQVKACPSGALSIKQDASAETKQKVSVVIQVFPDGPFLVKGSVSLEGVDGQNTDCEGATALCRCGASSNKPYCDGTHTKIGFKDPE